MTRIEGDVLRVDVPVGFLLAEARELLVSVDRPGDSPLSVRLRLIPAESDGLPDFGALPPRSADDTPSPTRRLRKLVHDGYPGHDVGGGD